MKTYQLLAVSLIAEAEGFSNTIYKCPAGFNTIGYGHNLDANPLTTDQKKLLEPNGSISKDAAMILLFDDLPKYEEEARELVDFDGLNDYRKALVIDLVYNLGKSGFEKFSVTIRFIRMGDYNNASKALKASKWFEQVGHRGVRNCAIMRDGVIYSYADIEELTSKMMRV